MMRGGNIQIIKFIANAKVEMGGKFNLRELHDFI